MPIKLILACPRCRRKTRVRMDDLELNDKGYLLWYCEANGRCHTYNRLLAHVGLGD